MVEEPNHEILKKLVKGEPLIINTSPADISISVPDKAGGENEHIYPISTSSDVIAISTSADLGIQMPSTYQGRFIERIEEVKTTRVEEAEFQFGLFKFRIKRAPQKTIIRYAEQQKDSE